MRSAEAVAAGRFLIVGIPGLQLDGETRRQLEELRPGGVILFARNVKNLLQLTELTADLEILLPDAVLWVDAEGGSVDRLASVVTPAPSGEWLAERSPRRAEQAGRWIGHALAALGLDANFAPVVDVDRGLTGNALDGRCLGTTAAAVTSRARAFLRGLHSAGVGGCVKHFPGLGAAPADTHHRPATIDLPAAELEEDLDPFRELAADAASVMVGHAVYPARDAQRPASLSKVWVGEVLRGELGFDGLVVADDVVMEGLAPWAGSPAERAEAAFEAGCDALLICHHLEQALEAAERLAEPHHRRRRVEATERWRAWRRHLAGLQKDVRRRYQLATVRERLAELG